METLLKQVIMNQRELKDAKHSQGMWVTLQLVEGDLKQVYIQFFFFLIEGFVLRKGGT